MSTTLPRAHSSKSDKPAAKVSRDSGACCGEGASHQSCDKMISCSYGGFWGNSFVSIQETKKKRKPHVTETWKHRHLRCHVGRSLRTV